MEIIIGVVVFSLCIGSGFIGMMIERLNEEKRKEAKKFRIDK